MNRPVSTFAHGIMDYVGGVALLLAPNIFGFADDGPDAAIWVPRVLGIIVLLQSVMTRYELGLAKILPMRMHLMNDYIASIFLALSPFIFGFNDRPANVWMPHVIVGLGVFIVSLLTQHEPRHRSAQDTLHSHGHHPVGR